MNRLFRKIGNLFGLGFVLFLLYIILALWVDPTVDCILAIIGTLLLLSGIVSCIGFSFKLLKEIRDDKHRDGNAGSGEGGVEKV